jgi:leucyl aminopeptidase
MLVRATTDDPPDTGADTVVVGVFDGKGIPHDVEGDALGALVESGEARSEFRSLTHAHAAGRRWILIGLGARDEFDAERARIAAAVALDRARELGARTLCWELPHKVDDRVAGALVEGTLLAAYRYTAFKSDPGEDRAPEALVVSAHHDVSGPVELGLPLRLVTVIGATENLVSSHAVRPGDIVRTRAGITIEVNNTDAEGRLVLADCLTHARDEGAERLLDLATLTGGIVAVFGPVHAGLMGNDDGWCDAVRMAGEATGERVWRLPLDPGYDELMKGRYADMVNSSEGRKAQVITAAALLARFAGDVPWAHLDIAGVADSLGRPYAPKGASGWGVRLLVELALRQQA